MACPFWSGYTFQVLAANTQAFLAPGFTLLSLTQKYLLLLLPKPATICDVKSNSTGAFGSLIASSFLLAITILQFPQRIIQVNNSLTVTFFPYINIPVLYTFAE